MRSKENLKAVNLSERRNFAPPDGDMLSVIELPPSSSHMPVIDFWEWHNRNYLWDESDTALDFYQQEVVFV